MNFVKINLPVEVKGHAHNRPRWPKGVPGRLRPRIFLTFGTTRVVGRQPHAPATFTPRGNPWYSFLEAESTPGHMVPSVATEKIPSVTDKNYAATCWKTFSGKNTTDRKQGQANKEVCSVLQNNRGEGTVFWCPEFEVALCVEECFKAFHTKLNFLGNILLHIQKA
jgi:hypothetical protein